ncbi:MAG: DEAD/DEAH box helicase [Candidatus Latescibacteria bacterium]|nr:DEAD/DEAH box helicase [bacterium]MBD3423916.1 DEAD/DEAH box helicase [Candidatus Latescibacterota bacterium]
MDTERFLNKVEASDFYQGQIAYSHRIRPRKARTGKLEPGLPRKLASVLEGSGIERLYLHQVAAVNNLRRGKSVVVVTSTASGKTLCYNIPVLERFLEDQQTRALYIYPTKALAQDQLRVLDRYSRDGIDIKAGTYDGDTPSSQRRQLREEANVILTNPDMLHSGILPNHAKWAGFFSRLEFVVIDEIHTYRGIFGSHVSNVIRRLDRISGHYGAHPVCAASSATIANPGEHAEKLLGREVEVIGDDGSPRGEKKFIMWNPPTIDQIGIDRRSSNTEAAEIIARLVTNNIQTIAFVRARVVSEVLTRYVRGIMGGLRRGGEDSVHPYRGGYLPEERREIERRLFEGDLKAVISTNALELGIDVGALHASVIVGYPGSIASTWQQAGRAGRGEEESLVFFIPHNTPLDQYLVKHPEYFFGRSPENAIIDPGNPHVLLGQIRAAAFELPLSGKEVKAMGDYAPAIALLLEEEGELNYLRGDWYWRGKGYPSASVNLRNISPNTYTIIDSTGDNRVIGTIDEASAFQQVHPQAIYLHEAETYMVDQLDTEKKIALVSRCDVDYYTQSITETQVKVDREQKREKWKVSEIAFGDVSVTDLTFMFRKIKFGSRDSIGYGKCDLPPQILKTAGLWLVPPPEVFSEVRKFGRVPSEGLLGLSNVLREVVPLFVMCDPLDIGTTVNARSTRGQAVYLYDKYPGGLGFSLKAYDLIEDIMKASLDLIESCNCKGGCPSCVGSPIPPFSQLDPDTGGRGMIPDRESALVILHALLEMEPYRPSAPRRQSSARELRRPEGKPLPVELEGKLREELYNRNRK